MVLLNQLKTFGHARSSTEYPTLPCLIQSLKYIRHEIQKTLLCKPYKALHFMRTLIVKGSEKWIYIENVDIDLCRKVIYQAM